MRRFFTLVLSLCFLLCMLPSAIALEDGDISLMDNIVYPNIYLEFVCVGQSEPTAILSPEASVTYNVMMYQDSEVEDAVNYITLGITYDQNLQNPQFTSCARDVSVQLRQSGGTNYMLVTKYTVDEDYPLTLSNTPVKLFSVTFTLPSAKAIQGYTEDGEMVLGIGNNGTYKVKEFSLISHPVLTYEITRARYQTGTTPIIVTPQIDGSPRLLYVDAAQLHMTDNYVHFTIKDAAGNVLPAGSSQPLNTGFKIEIDPGYRLKQNPISAGGSAPVAYYTPGSDIADSGTYDISATEGVYRISPLPHANATLLVAVEEIPFDLTVDFSNANPDDSGEKAEFVPVDGIEGDDEPYAVTVENPAEFKVDPDPDYVVKTVSYVPTDDPDAEPVVLTPDEDGVYTIPAEDITKPITVKIDTAFDVDKLDPYTDIVDSVTGGKRFGPYCVYAGSRSLVLFNTDELESAGLSAQIDGVELPIFLAPYTIDGKDYQCATLIDFASVLTEATPEAVKAYLETIIKPADAENAAVNYNFDVNGTGSFNLSDVSVTYDFTSQLSLNWTPSIELLLRADAVKTEASAQKLRVDAYDVKAFLNKFVELLG